MQQPIPSLSRTMNYRNFADMNEKLLAWLPNLPRDIDIIVGIPRSGMLPAELLSLHLNTQLADIEGFIEGRPFSTGPRYERANRLMIPGRQPKALIIDDSIRFGRQMREVRTRIKNLNLPYQIYFSAVYVEPGLEHLIDYYAEILPSPSIFEWNLMHHDYFIPHGCMDIDGVLCRDPLPSEDDDGARYQRFLNEVEPLYLPTQTVGWLVTGRLEKYRLQTEAWLAKQNVKYNELLMMDYPTAQARNQANQFGAFKAEVYIKSGAVFFVESSLHQSVEIANRSGKFVFCMETREMIQPGFVPRYHRISVDLSARIRRKLQKTFYKLRANNHT